MSQNINHIKQKLRKELLLNRSMNTDKNIDINITTTIFNFIKNFSFKNIGLYFPLPGEVQLLNHFIKLIDIQQKDYQILLPVVNDNEIFFTKYDRNIPLVPSKFNKLLHPSLQIEYFPEIIVLPGLAFSYNGYRLGFGKGHYDKYLSKLATQDKIFITIGVTFHKNLFLSLPFDKNDFRLDYIITDKIFIRNNA